MGSEAATWVRFTRLIPLEVGANLSARSTREAVAELRSRGWTADDIAHAVVPGIASARNPAALLQHNLRELVNGKVPPPLAPDETPTPPAFDRSRLAGPGVADPAPFAAQARAALASTKDRDRDRDAG